VKARRGRATSLRTRLFIAAGLIVVVSIGVTFTVGLVLTRRSVERANLDDLGHQTDLIAERERESLLPFVHLKPLKPFLARQSETYEVVDLSKPSAYLDADRRARLRRGEGLQGRVSVDGRTYLYAARLVGGKGFVLLRPARLSSADWWPFLKALLIAGLGGASLAALAAWFSARAIARPVHRVAEASRALAEGRSPQPVPVEGSAELAGLAASFNDMAEQLAQARDTERSFLLSVSHELKTPLTAIRGYAEALSDDAVGVDEAAATIRREAGRLERLVRDLLDLARLNQRSFSVALQPVDLAAVAAEAVGRHEGEAARVRPSSSRWRRRSTTSRPSSRRRRRRNARSCSRSATS
jgi:two-component system OmpR family sensor kinase